MYNITFDASDVSLNLTDINEGENQAHGFSVYNLFPDLPYIWPLYRLPSGRTVAGTKKTLEAANYTSNSFHVDFPNCLLTEHGRVLVQIVATNSTSESVDEIFDAYAAGTFTGKIVKSRVYEFYANESIDALQEMAAPSGGISQAVKDYIEDLVDEIIEGGGSVDPAVLNTKMDKANPTGSGAISVGRKANTTVGENSVALGHDAVASGIASVAAGDACAAHGGGSHAEGVFTSATGLASHSEGQETGASGTAAHAEGIFTRAYGDSQHVQGKYNEPDTNGRYAHIVGNGDGPTAPSNAHTLDWRGNAWFAGDVRVGGSDYDSGTPLAKATIVELYETTMSLAQSSYPISILNDSNENAITTYSDESLEPATELLLKAIANSVLLRIGDYPLTVVSTYDADDGATLLGYALVYNAEAMSAMNLQWKKIDDTKPIFVIPITLSNNNVGIFSSLDGMGSETEFKIVCDGSPAVKEELADVAFSGDYDDLKNKPTVFPRIPFGAATSTGSNPGEIVATIDGISSLLDGVSCWLQSTTLFGSNISTILLSLNVNGLGFKPIYMSCDHSTQATSDDFGIFVTGLFVYNSSLGTNGGWELYAGNVGNRPTTAEMNTAIQNAVANRPTTAEMNTAIQNAIGNAIGGSY